MKIKDEQEGRVMEFGELVRKRRSVRSFKMDEVSDEIIDGLIRVAHVAPSGSNAKNWFYVVVKTKEVKQKLLKAVEDRIAEIALKMNSKSAKDNFLAYTKYFTFFAEAPVVIACIMKKYDSLSTRIINRYDKENAVVTTAGIQNISASIENLLLAATDKGLGACWMTGPLIAKTKMEEVLNIDKEEDLAALIPIGWPNEEKKLNEFPENLGEIRKYM
ncbi:MAG: nitroreductase family protein [Candidatus Omnitrophica bacterium]|nr:nitroreductase family protein [Candidatus Omnitrophota bacterium]